MPSSSCPAMGLKASSFSRESGEEGVSSGERPGLELLRLRMKHQELGVEWAGWGSFFLYKNKASDAKPILNREEFYDSQGLLKER